MSKNIIKDVKKARKIIRENIMSFHKSVQAYWEFENKSHRMVTSDGEKLHRTEMNLISDIDSDESMSVTNLAEKYNVTKGAISQTLRKLEKKKLITKIRDPKNNSRVILRLTEEGKSIVTNHRRIHDDLTKKIEKILENESDDHLEFLHEFLQKISGALAEK